METYTFPGPFELRTIDALSLPVLTQDDPIFDLFPFEQSRYLDLVWTQKDNYIGLQKIRGLNNPSPTVQPPGYSMYQMKPGVYGEKMALDETMMLRTRQLANFAGIIDVSELVMDCQTYLLSREITRAKQICWDLVIQGYYRVFDEKGTLVQEESYTQRQFVPTVPWGTFATATPIQDIRTIQLLERGYSMSLGSDATMYLNRYTSNLMFQNTNANDLHGMRDRFGATLNNLGDLNAILMGEGLPKVVIHEDYYYDDASALHMLLPDGYVVIVARRQNNAPIGAFRMCANANNPGNAPGPHLIVDDERARKVPPTITVERGMNAGPVLYYPSAVVVMKVT